MAWIEKRGKTYHISFFHGGRHYSHSLKTGEAKKAEGAKARLEENLTDVERGRLEVPPGANLPLFLLSDGKLQTRVVVKKDMILGELVERYKNEMPEGAKDPSTRYTEDIHLGHILRLVGERFCAWWSEREWLPLGVFAMVKRCGRCAPVCRSKACPCDKY